MILGFLGALGLGIFVSTSLTKTLNRISQGLHMGAEQVASASSQISSASQQLAEGASEQAASIEETSSSLEEMAAMTKQNSDNASQADALMKENNGVVSRAKDSMVNLTASMNEINKASEDTSKIIKTIDEIAFQTNLLALNAAVEAARAGEAGAGFAVVADEVRNLAMRAADAAKDTSNLIEGTLQKVSQGSDYVAQTAEAFEQVKEHSIHAGDLVTEIAAASKEQSDGIDELNRAVTEVDRVVQQNAASAEETSSASQEMSSQADTMQGHVNRLFSLVNGGKNGSMTAKTPQPIPAAQLQRVEAPGQTALQPQVLKTNKGQQVDPETVIPFDDEDLTNF
jgi:methyl-accepting chemotaxis protein